MGEKRDRDSKKVRSSSRRNSSYTPLNAPLDQVLMQIKDESYVLKQQIEVLIKQGKLKNFLGQNHKDERLLMKGKAEEPLRPLLGEIRVIVGETSIGGLSKAKKTYLRVVQNIQLIGRPPRVLGAKEPTISFTDEDARRLHHPHYDAIIITLTIANYTTRRC